MDTFPPDLGKFVLPGFINANPPGQPEFALSPDNSGFAASLQLGGGEVTVGPDGGISLLVPGLATIGIDANNDITLASGTGVINILTEGDGNDVNILNAGTIAFDELGEGALTGVQTINGAVYPPAGVAATSITQAGALVACLGNGAINISSIGGGVVTDIYNAGTIDFDTAGAAAITNISTINGSAYFPFSGSLSSITNTGGYVEVTADTIALQTSGNAFMTLEGTGAVNPDKVEITSGSGNAAVVLGPSNTILLDNPGATLPSYITMTDEGNVEINGAAVNIGNLSTISGIASANLNIVGYGTYVYGSNTATFGDGAGAGFEVVAGQNRVIGMSGLIVDANLSVSTITDVSTINGVAYPALVSNIGDIATGGFVYTTTSNVLMGVGATAFAIDISNNLIVGSATANTSIVYASTIQASGDGLNIFENTAGANVKLDTGGRVKFNEGFSTITDGTGLIVGTEGSSLGFPLDTTATFGVGAIEGLSTINGVAYPIPVIQATYAKSVAQTMTSGANDVTFDLTQAYNNDAGYITHTPGTADFTVTQDGVYQLEFNVAIVANGATWGTGSNKTINIDITRSPSAETAIISSACLTASANNYSQCVSATYALEAGDVINLRVFNTFATAVPNIQGFSGFDLNTFFTWRLIA